MNSSKIVLGLALIAFCCVTFSHSLKCYTCSSVKDCKSATKNECNQRLANETRLNVDFYHIGVNMNATSTSYECYTEKMKTSIGDVYYKGCVYGNQNGCNLALKANIANSVRDRSCKQCNHKDLCNPAGRADINVMTVFATLMALVIGKYVWSH